MSRIVQAGNSHFLRQHPPSISSAPQILLSIEARVFGLSQPVLSGDGFRGHAYGGKMKSISDEIYIIKRLNYGLIRGKKVKILEGVVLKHLAVEPFGRGDGDITQGRAIADWRWLACGRTWLQRYWNSLNAIRLPWQSGH